MIRHVSADPLNRLRPICVQGGDSVHPQRMPYCPEKAASETLGPRAGGSGEVAGLAGRRGKAGKVARTSAGAKGMPPAASFDVILCGRSSVMSGS